MGSITSVSKQGFVETELDLFFKSFNKRTPLFNISVWGFVCKPGARVILNVEMRANGVNT